MHSWKLRAQRFRLSIRIASELAVYIGTRYNSTNSPHAPSALTCARVYARERNPEITLRGQIRHNTQHTLNTHTITSHHTRWLLSPSGVCG